MTILLPKEQHLAQAGLASLPPGWSVIELGTLLSEARGISVGVMYPGDHDPSGVPLIKVGDLGGSEINESPPFRISHQVHQEYRRTALEGGELLLTLVGAVGQCAIVPSSMKGWNAARAIAVLRFRHPEDAEFVRLCLLSEPLQYLMNAWSNTTVQTTLNLKEVRLLPLPWPGDTHERRRIAATFGCLDDKLRLNRRMNQTLEALAAAIFKAWFIDFEPVKAKAAGAKSFPSMPQPVFDALPSSLVPAPNSPSGEIPRGWAVGLLGEIVEQIRDAIEPGDVSPEFRYIGLEHMPRGSICLDQNGAPEDVSSLKMRFSKGDILFGKLRPYFKKVGIPGFAGICSSDIIVARPKDKRDLAFAIGHLSSQEFIDYCDRCSNGAKMPRVNWSDMARYEVVIAPEPVMAAATELFSPLIQQIHGNIEESATLAALRDLLLPKLLSGEVRVETAEFRKEAAGV